MFYSQELGEAQHFWIIMKPCRMKPCCARPSTQYTDADMPRVRLIKSAHHLIPTIIRYELNLNQKTVHEILVYSLSPASNCWLQNPLSCNVQCHITFSVKNYVVKKPKKLQPSVPLILVHMIIFLFKTSKANSSA